MSTDTSTHPNDLHDLEAQLTRHLELDVQAQDLLFREARTANAFTDEPVSDEQVRAVYDLVKWAPTSMNIQPLRIVLVRSPEARERLVGHLSPGNQPKTSEAPLVAILAADHSFHDEMERTFPIRPAARELFVGDDDFRGFTARLNATLQVAYFIIGVRAAGLAAGPMTGFDVDGVTHEFFPDGEHRALVVVNLGHPADDAWMDRLPRLDYEDVVTTV
ncbi:MAG TPA: malonic semialdehyde reductase [Segeticoccus sp.]|jgi:nitroreductase|nr:malonic semialdehyde reductase [Segeticoccus sp.]